MTGWAGGGGKKTWEGVRGNSNSTKVRKPCGWISMVITPEHMQHSHTHTAAMTQVLNVLNVTLE
jgi:hypothetical protein